MFCSVGKDQDQQAKTAPPRKCVKCDLPVKVGDAIRHKNGSHVAHAWC